MSQELIEVYAGGANRLSMAVRGLSAEDMAAKPQGGNSGKWSIQELLAHLVDSEGVFADRMKRVMAEENPPLLAFNENHWAAHLAYDQRKPEDSLGLFMGIRKQMATIMRHLPPAAWQRAGIHSEAGKITLAQVVEKANKHLEHHLEFIHAKRRMMGKEMW